MLPSGQLRRDALRGLRTRTLASNAAPTMRRIRQLSLDGPVEPPNESVGGRVTLGASVAPSTLWDSDVDVDVVASVVEDASTVEVNAVVEDDATVEVETVLEDVSVVDADVLVVVVTGWHPL